MRTLLFFLSALCCFGQADYTLLQQRGGSAYVAPTYFFEENFDDQTNTWTSPNGWMWLRSTNVIGGTYSGSLSNATGFAYSYASFTGRDTVYGKFRYRLISESTGNFPRFTLSRVGVNDDLIITFRFTGGQSRAYHGPLTGGSDATGTYVSDLNTNLFCWFKWVKGSGANGLLDVYLTNVNARPNLADISITNGVGTAQPTSLSVQTDNGDGAADCLIIDDIQLSETGFPTP